MSKHCHYCLALEKVFDLLKFVVLPYFIRERLGPRTGQRAALHAQPKKLVAAWSCCHT
jgi:hypothetical protein